VSGKYESVKKILKIAVWFGLILLHNGWLDEAYGDLMNKTFQNSTKPNL